MPAEIRIVHGEDEAKHALKKKLEEAGATRVLVPNSTAIVASAAPAVPMIASWQQE